MDGQKLLPSPRPEPIDVCEWLSRAELERLRFAAWYERNRHGDEPEAAVVRPVDDRGEDV